MLQTNLNKSPNMSLLLSENPGMTTAAKSPAPECCMCGDHGLSEQLFRCRLCLFRSQHKYCSNDYPKAEVYTVCNWCVHEEGKKKRAHVDGGDAIEGSPRGRKRIVTVGRLEEIMRIRRTKSENMGGSQNSKQVLRNKVRRYKLLDEVCT